MFVHVLVNLLLTLAGETHFILLRLRFSAGYTNAALSENDGHIQRLLARCCSYSLHLSTLHHM